MTDKKKTGISITATTTVSLGLVIAVLSFIKPEYKEYMSLNFKVEAQAKEIDDLTSANKILLKETKNINDKLNEISSDLKVIKYRLNKER